jgi:hypothetical protein
MFLRFLQEGVRVIVVGWDFISFYRVYLLDSFSSPLWGRVGRVLLVVWLGGRWK